MKPTYTRRYRPRSSVSCEGKKNCHENFFGDPEQDMFFQPSIYSTQEPTIHPGRPTIHRKCEQCEKEDKQVHRAAEEKEEVHRMEDSGDGALQRAMDPEKKEEKPVQRMEGAVAVGAATAACAPMSMGGVSRYIGSLPGKGAPLPVPARRFFETRMGHDFSGVRVHTGEDAARSAKAVRAKAYTKGSDIVFNEGQYDVSTGEGKKLMAHELTHVMRNEGGDSGSIQRKYDGGTVNENVDLADQYIKYLKSGKKEEVLFFGHTIPFVNGKDTTLEQKGPVLKIPDPTADIDVQPSGTKFAATVKKAPENIVSYLTEIPDDSGKWIKDAPYKDVAGAYSKGHDCPGTVRVVVEAEPDGAAVHDHVKKHEGKHAKDIEALEHDFIAAYDKMVSTLHIEGDTAEAARSAVVKYVQDRAINMYAAFVGEFNRLSGVFHGTKEGKKGEFIPRKVDPDCTAMRVKVKS